MEPNGPEHDRAAAWLGYEVIPLGAPRQAVPKRLLRTAQRFSAGKVDEYHRVPKGRLTASGWLVSLLESAHESSRSNGRHRHGQVHLGRTLSGAGPPGRGHGR